LISTYFSQWYPILKIFAEQNRYQFQHILPERFGTVKLNPEDILIFQHYFPPELDRHRSIVIGSSAEIYQLQQQYRLFLPDLGHPVWSEVSLELFDEYNSVNAAPITKNVPKFFNYRTKPYCDLVYMTRQTSGNSLICLNDKVFTPVPNPSQNREREYVAFKLLFNILKLNLNPERIVDQTNYCVGELIPLQTFEQAARSTEPITIETPNGSQQTLDAGTRAMISQYVGIYTVNISSKRMEIPINLLNQAISATTKSFSFEQNWLTSFTKHSGLGHSVWLSQPYPELLLFIIALLIFDWLYFYKPWLAPEAKENLSKQ
jgi:hypothetical protein